MTKLYRVCCYGECEGVVAHERAAALPGAEASLTGFWTRSSEACQRLKDARDAKMASMTGGGGSWARVYVVDVDAVKMGSVAEHKDGDDKDFDNEEVFVSKVYGPVLGPYTTVEDAK